MNLTPIIDGADENPKLNWIGKLGRTGRGFEMVEFADLYDAKCTLQASGFAIYDEPGVSAVWLGPDDANPQILASNAKAHGVETDQTTGWVKYPIPEDVLLNTRMHLSRDQVQGLIHHLQGWLDNGTFHLGGAVEENTPVVSDLEAYTSMLARAGIEYEIKRTKENETIVSSLVGASGWAVHTFNKNGALVKVDAGES